MGIRELINKSLETITVIREINHPVSKREIERLKTPSDVLLHSASILSDIQEMVINNSKPDRIYPEINEAKFFIFKAIEYLNLNPECPFKDLCPYYHKAKTLNPSSE
jgi:hypothetical protein